MFKSKTGFPLHAAVRLQREDVVFLYLVENNADVSINDSFHFSDFFVRSGSLNNLLGFVSCLHFIM
jgi:hypothetical protein